MLLLGSAAQAQQEQGLACSELTVFVREGCPHCRDAKAYLADLQQRLPGLTVEVVDVRQTQAAMQRFQRINEERRIQQPGVPTFVFCDEVLVGFDEPATTGASIERVLTGQVENLGETLRVNLPLFGEVAPDNMGLPLFTVAIGLIDGFNPCAMWVLLFLLSLLVHVEGRARILLIASTFVLVSGVVYFAFMAAWLNVYLLLGFSRGLQLFLGLLAALIGVVHLKEFFGLHQGPRLAIPEAVKPTIYHRVLRVVRAENLPLAMLGVTGVAVLVNFVELLCTAGLPALYTHVLTYYPLGNADYYGYLLLYNLAYIFDDAVMVAIAVVTLGQYKLQERGGRWLKLVSGLVVFTLGLVLVFVPDWLVF